MYMIYIYIGLCLFLFFLLGFSYRKYLKVCFLSTFVLFLLSPNVNNLNILLFVSFPLSLGLALISAMLKRSVSLHLLEMIQKGSVDENHINSLLNHRIDEIKKTGFVELGSSAYLITLRGIWAARLVKGLRICF